MSLLVSKILVKNRPMLFTLSCLHRDYLVPAIPFLSFYFERSAIILAAPRFLPNTGQFSSLLYFSSNK